MMFIGGISEGLIQTLLNGLATLVLTASVALGVFIFKGIKRILARLDHLDDCMDDMKKQYAADRDETVIFRTDQLAARRAAEADVAEMERRYAGLEGWIKGLYNKPIDSQITEVKPDRGVV